MSLVTSARLIESEAMTLTTAAVENRPRAALESVAALRAYVDAATAQAVSAALDDGCDAAEIYALLGMSE